MDVKMREETTAGLTRKVYYIELPDVTVEFRGSGAKRAALEMAAMDQPVDPDDAAEMKAKVHAVIKNVPIVGGLLADMVRHLPNAGEFVAQLNAELNPVH